MGVCRYSTQIRTRSLSAHQGKPNPVSGEFVCYGFYLGSLDAHDYGRSQLYTPSETAEIDRKTGDVPSNPRIKPFTLYWMGGYSNQHVSIRMSEMPNMPLQALSIGQTRPRLYSVKSAPRRTQNHGLHPLRECNSRKPVVLLPPFDEEYGRLHG